MLEERFDDLVLHANQDMIANHVDFQCLRQSMVRLPYELKIGNKLFLKECIDDLRKAKSVDDLFITAKEYWDYLDYSRLQHIINRHASDMIKKEMNMYEQDLIAFRKRTSLGLFLKVYKKKSKKADVHFRKFVSKHNIHWSTATLEFLEHFRLDFYSELSLLDFVLQLASISFH